MMNTRDVLIRARALIDHPTKWARGKYSHYGRLCSFAAVREVTDDVDDVIAAK